VPVREASKRQVQTGHEGVQVITRAAAYRALMCVVCDVCDQPKTSGRSFCSRCSALLPKHMSSELNRRLGEGYEGAYEDAKRCIEQRRQTAKEVGAGRHTRTR
jgi:hypothetical protein